MTYMQTYLNRMTDMYLTIHPNLDRQSVLNTITEFVHQQYKNIPCVMNNTTTHERIETSVCDVFDWINTRSPIITGNGTFFKQHEEYLAPVIPFLEDLKKDRSAEKKLMLDCKEGTPEYLTHNVAQLNLKVISNAEYGGSGTQFSPFYSVYIPATTTGSAKNTTTTLICCLEFLSMNNNKWAKLKDVNELFDMIYIILNDTSDRELINDSYTVKELTKHLMSRVLYYTPEDVIIVKSYISTLRPDQITKLMLAFNVKLVLKKYLVNDISVLANYMKLHQLDVDHQMTEESLYVAGFGVKCPDELMDTFEHVKKVILDNCCYPFLLNDAETRANEMTREVVCVTDTDSLMVHFASYVNEFQTNSDNFRDACLMATAIGLRLFVDNGGIIPRMVEYVALGCNIKDEYYRKKFKFKNEFGFLAMALFAKKMYASSCFVQEGKPRNIHKIAISGMSFKKRDAAEFLGPIMVDLYDKHILTTKKIQVSAILDKYYEWREILNNNIENDTSYYQVLGLKEVGAYDAKKILPEQMRGALIWNELGIDEEMQPMDRVIVIKLSWKKLEEHLHENNLIRLMYEFNKALKTNRGSLARGSEERGEYTINNQNMSKDPVICIPENYDSIPEWIKICIDKEGTIDKLLTPFKQILGLFDVYIAETRSGMIASRMVSI